MITNVIHIIAARSISGCSPQERAHEKARHWKFVKSLDCDEVGSVPITKTHILNLK